jgi:hypothetical protein
MTHSTKNADEPQPAYSIVRNMINSQSSNVSV